MSNQSGPPATMHELLGTKNKKEQVMRVKTLMGQTNAPVVDLIVRYDGRTDQLNISLVGPDISIENLYRILDGARDMLKQREFEAMKEKEDQDPPPVDPTRQTPPTRQTVP